MAYYVVFCLHLDLLGGMFPKVLYAFLFLMRATCLSFHASLGSVTPTVLGERLKQMESA